MPTRITSYNVCYTKLLRRVDLGAQPLADADRLRLAVVVPGNYDPAQGDLFADRLGRQVFGVCNRQHLGGDDALAGLRITSYNVCYTKLLRSDCQ